MKYLSFADLLWHARFLKDAGFTRTQRQICLLHLLEGARFYID